MLYFYLINQEHIIHLKIFENVCIVGDVEDIKRDLSSFRYDIINKLEKRTQTIQDTINALRLDLIMQQHENQKDNKRSTSTSERNSDSMSDDYSDDNISLKDIVAEIMPEPLKK